MGRRAAQVLTALLYNLNLGGFLNGKLYRGGLKRVCVPGLNCYSCPGALGACPLGSLQAVLGSMEQRFSLYVAGLLLAFGTLFGRLICGWACPFGLVQELLYKIPGRKLKNLRLFDVLKYLKYVLLAVFVIALPAITLATSGVGVPAFCKYICPAGTLEAGVPLVILNPALRSAAGLLFDWKLLALLAVVAASVFIFRPFCRFICPLGALYGLFNKISVFGLSFDERRCTDCGACSAACKMEVRPQLKPDSAECIRCFDCVKACPTGALRRRPGFSKRSGGAARGRPRDG